jgi:hypothetical protein
VRHAEIRLVEHGITVQNQIEIERARCACVRPLSSELALDFEQALQQRAGIERCLSDDDAVQERGLIADADRRRSVEGGHAKVGDEILERRDRLTQIALTISQVAPERDGDWNRIQRVEIQRDGPAEA